mmetsp:Transcript_9211/g.30420  ORF Transcript_9211/g.30420 Transcript_9211/m.30420 type:complete len:384 (-) Transcript_9211:1205-2356(-)
MYVVVSPDTSMLKMCSPVSKSSMFPFVSHALKMSRESALISTVNADATLRAARWAPMIKSPLFHRIRDSTAVLSVASAVEMSSRNARASGRKISSTLVSGSAIVAACTRTPTSSTSSGSVFSRTNAATRLTANLRMSGSRRANSNRKNGWYMDVEPSKNPDASLAPPLKASAASDLLPCVSGCKCSNNTKSCERNCMVHSDHMMGTSGFAPGSPTSTSAVTLLTVAQNKRNAAHVFDESFTSIPGSAAMSADAMNSLTFMYASPSLSSKMVFSGSCNNGRTHAVRQFSAGTSRLVAVSCDNASSNRMSTVGKITRGHMYANRDVATIDACLKVLFFENMPRSVNRFIVVANRSTASTSHPSRAWTNFSVYLIQNRINDIKFPT